MTRCINIDWLEVYGHEIQDGQTRDADFYRGQGLEVLARDYGTRQYEQMFTIMDDCGEKWIEVRRKPKGLQSVTGFSVLDEGSCHIRLCNRTCYATNAASIMQQFCDKYGIIISRISRIDICLDFERFDSGDDPQKFINRYLKGIYSKINQSNVRANGKDLWDGRFWNSLSWGAEKSQITTKIYNKTLEISERRDKPYIRQAWASCGLVDDFIELNKRNKEGEIYHPQIWRIEFSIKSSVKKWYIIEDVHTSKKKIRSIHHTLEQYSDREKLMQHFAGLVHHYFHFKKFIRNQRKDRCPDKVLFDFSQLNTFYEVQHIATANTNSRTIETLKHRLCAYKLKHPHGEEAKAIDAVLEIIQSDLLKESASSAQCRNELLALQRLITRRITGNFQTTFNDELNIIEALTNLDTILF